MTTSARAEILSLLPIAAYKCRHNSTEGYGTGKNVKCEQRRITAGSRKGLMDSSMDSSIHLFKPNYEGI